MRLFTSVASLSEVTVFIRFIKLSLMKKKLFIFVLFFIPFVFPFPIFAQETATSTVTINVRYRDTLVWSGPVTITLNETSSISDNSETSRQIPSNSALIALKTADDSATEFIISDLIYYSSFSSLYINCINIVSPSVNACGNWQYVVNSTYPSVGVDKYILSGNEVLYFYFGSPRRVSLSSANIETSTAVTVRALNYDYVNNLWTALSGATLGATQTNPDDPYSPIVVTSVTSDENGFAQILLTAPGSYNIGLAMDYYFPAETLSVSAPLAVAGPTPEVTPETISTPTVTTASVSGGGSRHRSSSDNQNNQAVITTTTSTTTVKNLKPKEVMVVMDISVENFIKKYQIALQNQKYSTKKVESEVKLSENQLAGIAIAVEKNPTIINKIFNKFLKFIGFKK
ncbi:MAG: hypothetical protein AAB484_01620 [Patescibacteria group bacterium]